MGVSKRDCLVATLTALAMTLNFFWFDLPGHGNAFLEADLALRAAALDGHTCFLIGMFIASLTTVVVPRWFERHPLPVMYGSAVLGVVAAAVQYAPLPFSVVTVATVATGIANIWLLVVDVLLLPHIVDRRVAGITIVGVFVLRGFCMYFANECLSDGEQHVLFVALPVACAVLSHAAARVLSCAPGSGLDAFKFEKPLSTAMLGLLIISSMAFAVACAVGNTGFWGTPFALTGTRVHVVLIGVAAFSVITYVTLVKTEASLLLRFMPGLLVLFVAYSFLYIGEGMGFGLSEPMFLSVGHFAEYYGEAFSWFVILLAVRTLEMPPYRTVGLSFCVNSAMTIVFQVLIAMNDNSALLIVQMGFFAMLAVLVWALYHFYGIGNHFRNVRCLECAKKAGLGVADFNLQEAAGAAGEEEGEPRIVTMPFAAHSEPLLRIAAAYGLSERETDVFVLLAQGHSRRYICDQLFIANGTAGTHISRIYDKMHVSSRQELLLLVRDDMTEGDG